ncbi:MAG: hypothetical protein FJ006_06365 [Chloroflexi bacterium]|nr:hypothetical protein [Chloroflexota bacterium]
MNIFRSGLGVALVVLVMIALLGGACGPKEAPAPTLPPVPTGNQPPVISSLTAANMQLYPSGNTEIQCIAQDADGDQLDFKWACTGGSFSGAGPTVIWQAPAAYGTYDVKVTVEDRKGGSAQASLTITVGANQPPVISSLTANPSGILYGGSTTLTCIASDPDGDIVRYSWSASEGNITGVGNKVTWVAPNKGGNYNITVILSDGKGGETKGNVMVTVAAAVRTVTITPVAQETGTVDSEGDKDNSRTRAGDDEKNVGYCAFWSFDVWSLAGKRIDNASLKFTTRQIAGNPFPATTGLNGLWLWKVTYGDKLPKFHYTGSKLQRSTLLMSPPTVVDVTPEVALIADAAITRFQVEALFQKVTNGNNVAEWIEWSEVVLEVTYSEK